MVFVETDNFLHSCRANWLRGRASDSQLRELGVESCAAVLCGQVFSLHCTSSVSCINEYLAIDSGGYVYDQPSGISCSREVEMVSN